MPPPGPDVAALQAGAFVGHCRLIRPLGQGGAGSVWEAEDLVLRRRVALKALHPQHAQDPARQRRFAREARIMAALGGQGCPALHHFGEEGGIYFFTMTLVQGQPLSDHLGGEGPLSFAQLRPLMDQLLPLLARLHRLGVAHRDIKPDHLLLTRTADGPTLWLIDFSCAKPMNETDQLGPFYEAGLAPGLTPFGSTLGTPGYIAPELLQQLPATPACDLFSLGVSAVELLMGRRWLSGMDRATRQQWWRRGAAHDLAGLGLKPPQAAWLKGLLAVKPDERFADAPTAQGALRLLAQETASAATTAPQPSPVFQALLRTPPAPASAMPAYGRAWMLLLGMVGLCAGLFWLASGLKKDRASHGPAPPRREVWLSPPATLRRGEKVRYEGALTQVRPVMGGWEFNAGAQRLRWPNPQGRLAEGQRVRLFGRVAGWSEGVLVLEPTALWLAAGE